MTSSARPTHPLVDFLIHLFLAVAMLSVLAVGIVLMLICTAIDGVVRGVARIRGK